MRQEDPRRLGPTLGWAAQMAKCAMDARVSRYDVTPVQAHVLKTPAKYIGVIGSRKKTAAVFARLKEMGYADADLARITTPIGLDIKAETPAEIAVSITAQLIQLRALVSGRN